MKEKVLLLFPPNLGKTTILSVLPISAPLLLTDDSFPQERHQGALGRRGVVHGDIKRATGLLACLSSHGSVLTVRGE